MLTKKFFSYIREAFQKKQITYTIRFNYGDAV